MFRLLFTVFLLWPMTARAAENSGPELLPAGIKMFVGLLLVVGLLLGIYALSKRGFGFLPSAKTGAIKIIETRSLGARKAICLVEVQGQKLLLSVGNERIELLYGFGKQLGSSRFDRTLRESSEA